MNNSTLSSSRPTRAVLALAPRLRFNMGYWDAAVLVALKKTRADGVTAETIVSRHFDPFYAHGFVKGDEAQRALGSQEAGSGEAWDAFLLRLKDPELLRQLQEPTVSEAVSCGRERRIERDALDLVDILMKSGEDTFRDAFRTLIQDRKLGIWEACCLEERCRAVFTRESKKQKSSPIGTISVHLSQPWADRIAKDPKVQEAEEEVVAAMKNVAAPPIFLPLTEDEEDRPFNFDPEGRADS